MPEQESIRRIWRRRRRRRRPLCLPLFIVAVAVAAIAIGSFSVLSFAQPNQLARADRVACGAAGCVVTTPRVVYT